MKRKIIVIGSGWSGSGAVFEYLAGRPDVFDPFTGNEFRIVGDPGGVFELHTKLKHAFTVQGADNAIKDFLRVCQSNNKLPKLKFKKPPIDMDIVNSFIKNIVFLKYEGLAAYEYHLKPLHYQLYAFVMRKISESRGKKANIGEMYYPVNEEEFIKQAKVMLNLFINDKSEHSFSVINHGGTFWNPVSSTQYYGDRHVFIVVRDPRDIFVELKAEGNAYPTRSVDVFCTWYLDMMNRINKTEWESENVSIVKFEEFVNNFDNSKNRIDKTLGLDTNVESSLNIEKSKRNIGKYKNALSESEISYIEKNLRTFLHT